MLCQYRELSPDLSAACSCVMPVSIRIAAMFLPKRARREQVTGFFDGMPRIVAEKEKTKHEALPRFQKMLRLHCLLQN